MVYIKSSENKGTVVVSKGDVFKLNERQMGNYVSILDTDSRASLLVDYDKVITYFNKIDTDFIAIKDIEIDVKYYTGDEIKEVFSSHTDNKYYDKISHGRKDGITVLKMVQYCGYVNEWN